MPYHGILFDFDGTLFDTWPGLVAAYQATHKHYFGRAWQPLPARTVLLMPRRSALHNMMGHIPTPEQEQFFVNAYQATMLDNSPAFPGALETLAWLNDIGMPWGIASNKPYEHMAKFLEHLPVLTTAHCVVCANETLRRKPESDILLHASEKLGLTASNLLYVGDHEHDLHAANACGMACAFVHYGYMADRSQLGQYNIAIHIYQSCLELCDFIKPS